MNAKAVRGLVAPAVMALAACKAKPTSLAAPIAQALPVTAASLEGAPKAAPPVTGEEAARAIALFREAAPPRCTGTRFRVLQHDELRCAYVCAADRECLGGTTCEAAIALTDAAGQAKDPTYTKVCSSSKGAGAGAGKASAVPSLFGAAHAANGQCPAGFVGAPKIGALCYRACQTDRECPESSSCRVTEGVKLCRVD